MPMSGFCCEIMFAGSYGEYGIMSYNIKDTEKKTAVGCHARILKDAFMLSCRRRACRIGTCILGAKRYYHRRWQE
jgi:hypothetical protein